jgi:hypothetical protein
MKNKNQEPVEVVLTYNANSTEKTNLRTKIVPGSEKTGKLKKLDENNKLVRRYSFDDNGGGYLGL